MLYEYGKRTRDFFEAFLFFFNFSLLYFWGVFNETIIPLALVGYEMDSQLGAVRLVGYLPSQLIQTRACGTIRDFKIRDATASRTRWLINGLGLERRRLRGKSKVKIPVWMQDNVAGKRSFSVRFFGMSFAEIATASFKKDHEMLCLCLIEEIIDEEEFVLLYEAYRPSNLPFPHSAYEKFSLAN